MGATTMAPGPESRMCIRTVDCHPIFGLLLRPGEGFNQGKGSPPEEGRAYPLRGVAAQPGTYNSSSQSRWGQGECGEAAFLAVFTMFQETANKREPNKRKPRGVGTKSQNVVRPWTFF